MRNLRNVYLGLLLGFSGTAEAASVFVQYASPTVFPDILIIDPLLATATDVGIFARADLTVGKFQGFAYHDGSSAIASAAYSGILDLTLTNSGAMPVSIGGASFPFYVDLTSSFAGSIGGPTGYTSNQLSATLTVSDPACLCARVAQVNYFYVESWFEGALVDAQLSATPVVDNGGTVSITTATRGSLAAILSMPVIGIPPGGSVIVTFSFLPVAVANEAGFDATTDASTSAYIRLFVPAGSNITTDAGPLPWIGVPEPIGALPLGAAGVLLLAGWRRRCRGRAVSPDGPH